MMSGNKKNNTDNSNRGNRNIPVFDLNAPNNGPQQTRVVTPNTAVFSAYTGERINFGPIPYNTPNDAPVGHPRHGKNYVAIQYTPGNDAFMAHGINFNQGFNQNSFF